MLDRPKQTVRGGGEGIIDNVALKFIPRNQFDRIVRGFAVSYHPTEAARLSALTPY